MCEGYFHREGDSRNVLEGKHIIMEGNSKEEWCLFVCVCVCVCVCVQARSGYYHREGITRDARGKAYGQAFWQQQGRTLCV